MSRADVQRLDACVCLVECNFGLCVRVELIFMFVIVYVFDVDV